MKSLFPNWMTSYIGHVFISKRLRLRPWSEWSLCTVQTCRGDFQRATLVTWLRPAWLLAGWNVFFHKQNWNIHFSLGTPNVIPYSSPVLGAIYDADLGSLRDLFCRRIASIWDTDIDGRTAFWHACKLWQEDHDGDKWEIVRFYMDVGANSLLFAEASRAFSAHDSLTLGLLQHLSDHQPGCQSLAARLQTNPVAIEALRSLFNIDPMDALEDYANRKRSSIADVPGFLASFSDTECDPSDCLSVLKAFGYGPLEYAIRFSPQSVASVLEDGEDATSEPFLACAIERGRSFLIKPLLDASADVGIKGRRGYTALHQACFWCFYPCFNELVLWAGDRIDWDVRTPEGQSALDLFEIGVEEGRTWYLDQSEIDEWRSILVAHIGVRKDEHTADEPLHIPGAFPGPL
ncbi:hypothetical protein BDY19DRAFT_996628 [Irpex rosettiformis]|uniref:Uncharacterized protein n=1 Tax=Irpex rosettiformis TaxID=378272 RepID=A0ACB8TU55_9APHY|nr:hypothetical protein BDY19DRAFT_996628 [Irpex rosettiformis]